MAPLSVGVPFVRAARTMCPTTRLLTRVEEPSRDSRLLSALPCSVEATTRTFNVNGHGERPGAAIALACPGLPPASFVQYES